MHFPIRFILKILSHYHYRITWKRLWNLFCISQAMLVSRIFKKPVVWGHPCLLMVEPTNLCNLKCPMCPSGAGELTRAQGKMDVAACQRYLDTAGHYLMFVQFWNQGEPFVHPEFLEMVRYAKSKGICTQTSTNGHFIRSENEALAIVHSGLDEILISVDGLDQTTYAKYRVGGDFKTVLAGIRFLVAAKQKLQSRRPLVTLQFLVFKHNQHQAKNMVDLGRELQADVVALKSAQVYSDTQADTFLPEDESFRRYQKEAGGYHLKGKLPDWCKFLWYGAVLNWDGMLAPCCFDKNGDFAYGHVFNEETSPHLCWKGEKARVFRNKILYDRNQIDICRNCFEGIGQSYVRYVVL